MKKIIFFFSAVAVLASCQSARTQVAQHSGTDIGEIHYPQETHIRNVKQLTFGGNNAEAYFNNKGTQLVFQSDNSRWGVQCDQIFTLDLSDRPDSTKRKLLSTGKGRTTCSWFMPDDKHILFASTHLAGDSCPPPAPRNGKYVWSLYPGYDIFVSDLKGKVVKQLTNSPRYDAEATISPKGDRIVFTSLRTGDLELFTMNIDGTDVKQITNSPGYDGGATFSPDGKMLVWRASRPRTEEDLKEYQSLLAEDMVEPTDLEIWVANADGSNARQITSLGKANWSPTFTPKGDKVVFCSNYKSERGFPFNLFMIGIDGTGLEQITFDTAFDSFPMFSPDGKKLVWCSNRHNGRTRDTNIFIADWVD
jgi:Tol biopolymer transport system component